MKVYTQKDLGYPRTPTSAAYRVTMDNGTIWDVPAQAIADDRDTHYADEKEDTIGFIRKKELDEYDLTDWARNNMNWSDVKEYATPVPNVTKEPDWEEGWSNGENEIVGRV